MPFDSPRGTQMRVPTAFAFIALILVSLGAKAEIDTLRFPAEGTPYAHGRSQLLKQGALPLPEKADHHDSQFKELDCTIESTFSCRAVFIHKQRDGWRVFVVVYTDRHKNIVSADYPKPVEGLISIPPPIPPDMPPVRGNYLKARAKLRELGFKPARRSGEPAHVCVDRKCDRYVELREATCATDVPLCMTYWTARDGRVLSMELIGEINPRIYFMAWASRKELRAFLK